MEMKSKKKNFQIEGKENEEDSFEARLFLI